MVTKVDYNQLEREYIRSDVSIRELAGKHSISWSTVSAQARKRGWEDKRARFRSSRDEQLVERMAEKYADEHAEIRDEMLLILRAALRKFGQSLTEQDSNVQITAKDVSLLIPQIMLLLGEPTSRTESNVLGVFGNLSAEVDPEFVRELAEIARSRAKPRSVERTSRLEPAGAGSR